MARNLLGMEMVCFCKTEHFTLSYSGGGYADRRGEPVPDVMDMNCYVCTANFYSREGDFIDFCPNCGHFDRKGFTTREQLVDHLRGQDCTWLATNGLQAVTVQTWDKGDWQLKFVRNIAALEGGGQFKAVRAL